jgi:hypothetical protein
MGEGQNVFLAVTDESSGQGGGILCKVFLQCIMVSMLSISSRLDVLGSNLGYVV